MLDVLPLLPPVELNCIVPDTAQNYDQKRNTKGWDGSEDGVPPIQASDGNFYGSTSDGGSTTAGTIYKITSSGTLTTVYNLDPKNGDGAFPMGLVQHSNGIFYGPTIRGGKILYHSCPVWCGTLFSLSVP